MIIVRNNSLLPFCLLFSSPFPFFFFFFFKYYSPFSSSVGPTSSSLPFFS